MDNMCMQEHCHSDETSCVPTEVLVISFTPFLVDTTNKSGRNLQSLFDLYELKMHQILTVTDSSIFDLVCHTFFQSWDDFDFHCEHCCFILTFNL
jgi:hypothetical protein